jgi:hypothetical protein
MLPGRLRLRLVPALAALALGLAGAPAAEAATSTNWSGYVAARGTAVRFRHVSATWTQPAVACTPGAPTYSSTWVGLGGNRAASAALEQIGTEGDCTASGTARYSSWYELVPDVSHSARLTTGAGDRVHASVAVSGHRVTVKLADLTRGTSFTRTLRAAAVDTTSAEWIVEAPSLCADLTAASCEIGALADFGTTTFSAASATTAAGHAGTIADPAWSATSIDLAAFGGGGRRFASDARGGGAGGGGASTGALDATGAGFSVAFAAGPGGAQPALTGVTASAPRVAP